jgi:hypothetical protein
VLSGFKASSQLLPKCQFLLEHTQQPMLQFEIASAIQGAIVREYSEYQENDVSAFAGWLVQYCLHHTTYLLLYFSKFSLPAYVRDAILRSAAVALKRLSLSMTFNVTPHILDLVQNLADTHASSHIVLTFKFLLT